MLDTLHVYNFHSQAESTIDNAEVFQIKTCQRNLAISHGQDIANDLMPTDFTKYHGPKAYEFLLEIICGLQSKLIGENEIVGQFKKSYQDYWLNPQKQSRLLLILEKLFKDAKEIRTDHLLGLCQKTYASIARKHLVNLKNAEEVLVLGSGSLAEDLINQLKKKSKVCISARNSERVNQLANQHDIKIIPWKNIHLYKDFPFVANTIGFEGILLDESFFNKWAVQHEHRLFIDLGSPSAIKTDLDFQQGFMNLQDIFNEGAVHENHKKEQIKKARFAIADTVEKRYIHLKEKKLMRMRNGEFSEHRKAI